ncbi:MAG: hypothetical protein ACI4P3_02475 [Candidatus Spyradosoma sp.]
MILAEVFETRIERMETDSSVNKGIVLAEVFAEARTLNTRLFTIRYSLFIAFVPLISHLSSLLFFLLEVMEVKRSSATQIKTDSSRKTLADPFPQPFWGSDFPVAFGVFSKEISF